MKMALIAILLAFTLTGCAGLRASFGSRLGGHEILEFIDRLNRADADELAAIGERIEAEPGHGARTRRALWRGADGHDGHAPEQASAELRALLQENSGLDRDSRLLLRLQLDHLEEHARLARENRELGRQIEELTALERRMGGDDENDD